MIRTRLFALLNINELTVNTRFLRVRLGLMSGTLELSDSGRYTWEP